MAQCEGDIWFETHDGKTYDWDFSASSNIIEQGFLEPIDGGGPIFSNTNLVEFALGERHNPDNTLSFVLYEAGTSKKIAEYTNIRIDYITKSVQLINDMTLETTEWLVPTEMSWQDAIHHPYYDPPISFGFEGRNIVDEYNKHILSEAGEPVRDIDIVTEYNSYTWNCDIN